MRPPNSVLAVQYLRVISTHLDAMGIPVEQWLALSGLSKAQVVEPNFVLEFEVLRSLALDAMRISGEPALGLIVGERLGIVAHGILGYAVISSGSVREVLSVIQQYLSLRTALVAIRVDPRPDEVRVKFIPQVPLGELYPSLMETLVCIMKTVLDDVSMGKCQFRGAAFSFECPSHAAEAAAILSIPVTYEQGWDGLSLSPNMLDTPLKLSDPETFQLSEQLCRQQLNELEARQAWSDRVRRILLERRNPFPSEESIARHLHVSRRTLHRRLAAENTNYRLILDDIRQRLAIEHLEKGQANIDEIAYVLGYKESASFRRAFRRWTGASPSGYRQQVNGRIHDR